MNKQNATQSEQVVDKLSCRRSKQEERDLDLLNFRILMYNNIFNELIVIFY